MIESGNMLITHKEKTWKIIKILAMLATILTILICSHSIAQAATLTISANGKTTHVPLGDVSADNGYSLTEVGIFRSLYMKMDTGSSIGIYDFNFNVQYVRDGDGAVIETGWQPNGMNLDLPGAIIAVRMQIKADKAWAFRYNIHAEGDDNSLGASNIPQPSYAEFRMTNGPNGVGLWGKGKDTWLTMGWSRYQNRGVDGLILACGRWKYNIYYNANGGSLKSGASQAVQNVYYNNDVTLRNNIYERTGYTINNNWNTKADGTGTWYKQGVTGTNFAGVNNAVSEGKVTMFAQWTPHTYTVVYDSNKPSTASSNVSGSTASSGHTYDKAANLTGNGYSLTGWTFTGWNTKADGSGTGYSNKQSVSNLTSTDKGTVTLYAQWRVNTYTIKFDGNKGNGSSNINGSMSDQSMSYDNEKNLDANKYSRDGYTFTGWNTKSDGTGTGYSDKQAVNNLTSTDKGTVTLFAQWKANTYTVHFDGNKGNGSSNINGNMSDIVFTYDKYQNIPDNEYSRIGYNYDGWSTVPSGAGTSYSDKQSVVNLISAPTSDGSSVITLYAKWVARSWTIRYDGNQMAGSSRVNGSMGTQTAYYDEPIRLLANGYSRDGYNYHHWHCDSDNKDYDNLSTVVNVMPDPAADGSSVSTMKVMWDAVKYTIHFNGNKGNGSSNIVGDMDNQVLVYDQPVKINKNQYSRYGYTFSGWSRDNANNDMKYQDEEVIVNLLNAPNHDNTSVVEFYAKWVPIQYIVSYDGNGYTKGYTNSQLVTYDEHFNIRYSVFSKTGYLFTHWNEASDNSSDKSYQSNQDVVNLILDPSPDNKSVITLYAQYNPIHYFVRYNSNNGEGIMNDQEFTYDKQQSLSENQFTKEGNDFIGWSYDGTRVNYHDKQDVINLSDQNNAVITLNAVWRVQQFHVKFIDTITNDIVADHIVDYGTTITSDVLTNLPRQHDGYVFAGYDGNLEHITTDRDILINYSPLNLTVQFDANGGNSQLENLVIPYNETKNIPPTTQEQTNQITKPDYVFTNWNTSSDGTGTIIYPNQPYLNTQSNTTNTTLTLYAQYKKQDPATITASTQTTPKNTELNTVTPTVNNPTPTTQSITFTASTNNDYIFEGWVNVNEPDNIITTDTTITLNKPQNGWENTQYIAKYKQKTVNVTFTDGNGNILSQQTIPRGTDASVPKTPTRQGYTFKGWDNKNTKILTDITINALWEKNNTRVNTNTSTNNSNTNKQSTNTVPLYRLYNPNTGEHFYTMSQQEKTNLVNCGWRYEGIAYNVPKQDGEPVYRLYNPNTGDHHYTVSKVEYNQLKELGWNQEGTAWNTPNLNASGTKPVYRLYNPNATTGTHHYTVSKEEYNQLHTLGWNQEGIAWAAF